MLECIKPIQDNLEDVKEDDHDVKPELSPICTVSSVSLQLQLANTVFYDFCIELKHLSAIGYNFYAIIFFNVLEHKESQWDKIPT